MKIEIPINRVDSFIQQLESLMLLGGNLSDKNLTTKTGPNDAVARGQMYVASRHIAYNILENLKSYKASAIFCTGTRVKTKIDPKKVSQDWEKSALLLRKNNAKGTVVEEKHAHGHCFGVEHEDGVVAWYDPHELVLA